MKLYFSNTKPPHTASRNVGSYEYFLLVVYEKKIVLLSEKMAFWKGKKRGGSSLCRHWSLVPFSSAQKQFQWINFIYFTMKTETVWNVPRCLIVEVFFLLSFMWEIYLVLMWLSSVLTVSCGINFAHILDRLGCRLLVLLDVFLEAVSSISASDNEFPKEKNFRHVSGCSSLLVSRFMHMNLS